MDEISSLEQRRSALVEQGVWLGVYLSASKPGGTASNAASIQYRARCHQGGTLPNGRGSQYISAADLPWLRGCIARGQQVAAIDRRLARLRLSDRPQ